MIALGKHVLTVREHVEAAVRNAADRKVPQLPAILAAADDLIGLTFLMRAKAALPRHLVDAQHPHLVIVGDDPDAGAGVSTGPDGWRCARDLALYRPISALVYASGANPVNYLLATEAAMRFRRFLVIECSSASAMAWTRLTTNLCETVTLLPEDGEHPIRSTVH